MKQGKKFRLEPYLYTVRLYTDRAAYEDATDMDTTGTAGITAWSGFTISVGVFDNKVDTLVHECLHATMRALDGAGIDARESNSEAACYLLDHLVARCLRALGHSTKLQGQP